MRRFSLEPPDELDHVAVELRDLEASQTRRYEVLGVADLCIHTTGSAVYVQGNERMNKNLDSFNKVYSPFSQSNTNDNINKDTKNHVEVPIEVQTPGYVDDVDVGDEFFGVPDEKDGQDNSAKVVPKLT